MKKFLFLIVASLTMVISVLISLVYFRLSVEFIPPMAMSSFNRSAGRIAFIFWGLGIGVVLVLLEMLAFWLLPMLFQRKGSPSGPPPAR